MKCVDCGAEIVFGEPHEMRVTDSDGERVEIRCQICITDYAWAIWPEDWGPFPYQMHRAGNA